MYKSKLTETETRQSLRARLRMGILLFAFWLVLIVMAAFTFPFVEHISKAQNVGYGLIVGLPFLVVMGFYFAAAFKDLKEASATKKD